MDLLYPLTPSSAPVCLFRANAPYRAFLPWTVFLLRCRRQTVGKYMIEIWKATGMDMNNVEFLWASEEVGGEWPASSWCCCRRPRCLSVVMLDWI